MKSTELSFRACDWLNEKTGTIKYGIQVRKKGDKKWMHLAIDGKPFFARKEENRNKKIKILKNKK